MATATSSRRAVRVLGAVAAVVGVAAVAVALPAGTAGARHAAPVADRSAGGGLGFAWLQPGRAPRGWAHVSTPSGDATLSYPPTWTPLPGDPGTVTAALRDAAGNYHGYLNVTPRQGDEHLSTWAAFRLGRNREEGDTDVRALASAQGLHFRDALGSCVIDDYRSRVGAHPYREVACLVTGRRATDVLIGATLQPDWTTLGPDIERAVSSFSER